MIKKNKTDIAYWNYKVIKNENYEDDFSLHKVYYDLNGNIKAYTKDPVEVRGNDKNDLMKSIRNMLDGINKFPVLTMSELKKLIK